MANLIAGTVENTSELTVEVDVQRVGGGEAVIKAW
jgi:hypothetical protein